MAIVTQMTLDTAYKRALMYRAIRAFFEAQGVLEVQTPILSQAGNTDVFIDQIQSNGGFLRTSPEYPLKRLLARYKTCLFEMGACFRQEELSGRHNIEFSMLEWYRVGMPLNDLADEVIALIAHVAAALGVKAPSFNRLSYKDAFKRAGLPCPFRTELTILKALGVAHGIRGEGGRDFWCDALFCVVVEPSLGTAGVILSDYPASTAALACLDEDTEGDLVARRFEVYLGGLELANAYDEFNSQTGLKARFDHDNQTRLALGKAPMPLDERFLAVVDSVPPCSGVALGLDRLLMVMLGLNDIRQALAFSHLRS